MADLKEGAGDVAALSSESSKIGTDPNFKREIVWKNAIGFLFLHLAGVYGLYRGLLFAKNATLFWGIFIGLVSGEGITIGAHRLYTHKSFKATPLLKILLVVLQTVAGQNCMYIWVRDHRQHHRYSDTDADPHNATRGFFFSHCGWLMSKKHPMVKEKGKTIDMSDLEADPYVMFQKKYYKTLYTIFAIMIPVIVPVYLWNESWLNSLAYCYFFRYVLLLNITWSVNSVAHLWGMKPFNNKIMPVESHFVSFVGIGEGWHNYHHTFPWDYRAAEYGSRYNWTSDFIDMFYFLGLAYDLKTASPETVKGRILRTGDGSHHVYGGKEDEYYKKTDSSFKGFDLNSRDVSVKG